MSELEMWLSVPPIPAELPGHGCDWGYCDAPAVMWRWSEQHGAWLPVCLEHGEVPS